MPRDRFLQRKTAVLSKLDKSSAGNWDKKIKKLCDKINFKEQFYTTSSCSGRVLLMLDKEKKAPGLFLKAWHDAVSFPEIKGELNNLIGEKVVLSKRTSLGLSVNKNVDRLTTSDKIIKFKLEPPILHIVCKDLEGASNLLEKAISVGFKRSGLLSVGKNILLEMNSTERLEFPILNKGKILVDDNFLKLVIKQANEKLKRGWIRIEKLREII
jgi:tRNA wybutosine-synthesizing protein 3